MTKFITLTDSTVYIKFIGIVLLNTCLGCSIVNNVFLVEYHYWLKTALYILVSVTFVNIGFFLLWRYKLRQKISMIHLRLIIIWLGLSIALSFSVQLMLNPKHPIPNIVTERKLIIKAIDGEVRIGEIKVGKRKVPFKKIHIDDAWFMDNKSLATQKIPAQLTYSFTIQKIYEPLTIIFLEGPMAGEAKIAIDEINLGNISLRKDIVGETIFTKAIPLSKQQNYFFWFFRGIDVLTLTWIFTIVGLLMPESAEENAIKYFLLLWMFMVLLVYVIIFAPMEFWSWAFRWGIDPPLRIAQESLYDFFWTFRIWP